MENISSNNKSRIFSYSVLAFTLLVVITSLSSIVFPALIVRLVSNLQDNSISPFEPGLVAIPFLIVDSILIGIIILNYKEKLPTKISKIFSFIQQFDVSWKIALVIIIVLYAIYLAFTLSHIYSEELFDDYQIAKYQGTNWSFSIDNITFGFKYFLLHVSVIIFKNIRMIPLISSFLMLLLVYFTTLELTKKRIGSLIAVMIVLQSNNFLTYDSTASYANFWIFFYLLSLFLIVKKWYLSHIAYIFSVFSKGLTVIFIPMTLFFTLNSEISKRKKILVITPYLIMGLIFAVSTQIKGLVPDIPPISPNFQRFLDGFTSVSFQLRNDWLVLFCIIPLVIALYIRAKQKIFYAYSAMIFITWTLFSSPLLSGLTFYTLEPYRQIPVVIFFAIGVGILFSNRLSNGSKNSEF
jgi:hypothetical protein